MLYNVTPFDGVTLIAVVVLVCHGVGGIDPPA
jgi:hypothetical protein